MASGFVPIENAGYPLFTALAFPSYVPGPGVLNYVKSYVLTPIANLDLSNALGGSSYVPGPGIFTASLGSNYYLIPVPKPYAALLDKFYG